jgi:hypothetical protein
MREVTGFLGDLYEGFAASGCAENGVEDAER